MKCIVKHNASVYAENLVSIQANKMSLKRLSKRMINLQSEQKKGKEETKEVLDVLKKNLIKRTRRVLPNFGNKNDASNEIDLVSFSTKDISLEVSVVS